MKPEVDDMLAVLLAAFAVAGTSAIPAPLVTLEHVAEAIDDAVVANDWRKVQTLEADGNRAVLLLQAQRAADKQRASEALAKVRAATRSRNALGTRVAANHLADAVVDLYEPLNPVVPTSVMRLDVLLRTVDLAALDARPDDARRALARTQSIWRDLRSRPPIAGSQVEASFTKELEALDRAAKTDDLHAVRRAAVAALEGVDSLEAQFQRKSGKS